jgi:hypothetical protein
MIITPPARQQRDAMSYVAMQVLTTMEGLGAAIPTALDAVEAWMTDNGIEIDGPPIVRYRVIDMAVQLKVEIGWPVAELPPGAAPVVDGEQLVFDELPAGEYGACVFRGVDNGIAGNGALIDWGIENDVSWDRWEDPAGDAFASRFEVMLTGPEDNPDPAQWDTEVAILIAKD